MELVIGNEGNAQSSQPKHNNSASSASLQVKQADSNFEKIKAEPEKKTLSEQDIQYTIEHANKLMELFNNELRFEKHEETGIIKVSIVDKNDGKVIKQIPAEEILNMITMIQDILGSLIDVKV